MENEKITIEVTPEQLEMLWNSVNMFGSKLYSSKVDFCHCREVSEAMSKTAKEYGKLAKILTRYMR